MIPLRPLHPPTLKSKAGSLLRDYLFPPSLLTFWACSFGSFSAQKALLVLADRTLNGGDDYFRITVPCGLEKTQTPNDALLPRLPLPPRASQPGSQLMPHPQSPVPSRLEALELSHPSQDVRSSWKRDANNQPV